MKHHHCGWSVRLVGAQLSTRLLSFFFGLFRCFAVPIDVISNCQQLLKTVPQQKGGKTSSKRCVDASGFLSQASAAPGAPAWIRVLCCTGKVCDWLLTCGRICNLLSAQFITHDGRMMGTNGARFGRHLKDVRSHRRRGRFAPCLVVSKRTRKIRAKCLMSDFYWSF